MVIMVVTVDIFGGVGGVKVDVGSVGHVITLNENPKGHKFLGWLYCSVFFNNDTQ